MTRLPRPFASLALAVFGGLAVVTVGCGGPNPYQAAESANSVDTGTANAANTSGTNTSDTNTSDTNTSDTNTSGTNTSGTEANVFIPEGQNVSSCVGTVERPDCGSKSKGGWRMYLTFAVLIAGLSFVGWRIVKGVRSNGPVGEPPKVAPPTP